MEKIRVVIVDDQAEVATFMKMKLQKEAPGFEIKTFEAGGECLEYIRSGCADCILSDYQMPILNGMQLLSLVRGMGLDVPFIFITGQGNEGIAREAFKNGASDYFTKDIGFAHFTRIINSIEQAVRQRRLAVERKRAESALLEEKNKLEAVLGSIGEGISIQDRDLNIIYENKALTDIKGSHVGEKCYEVYGEGEVCGGCPVVESFADGETHTLVKSFVNSGLDKTLEITASPVKSSSGDIVAGVKVVRDITVREKLDQQRADFLAMVTQDLRSPLAEIIGAAELIAEGGRIDEGVRDAACRIVNTGKTIISMVNGFLSVTELEGIAAPQSSPPVRFTAHISTK